MIRNLAPNDELFVPGKQTPKSLVIDPRLRDGHVKLFDCDTHQERYVAFAELNAALVAGDLVLRRRDSPMVSAALIRG